MNNYEVCELHEWYCPYRWAVHKNGMPMNFYLTDKEAYAHMNSLINKENQDARKDNK